MRRTTLNFCLEAADPRTHVAVLCQLGAERGLEGGSADSRGAELRLQLRVLLQMKIHHTSYLEEMLNKI